MRWRRMWLGSQVEAHGPRVPNNQSHGHGAHASRLTRPSPCRFSATIWMLVVRHRLLRTDRLYLARTLWAMQDIGVHNRVSTFFVEPASVDGVALLPLEGEGTLRVAQMCAHLV